MSVYEKAKEKRATAPTWKKELTKELLKPKRKRFPRRRIFSPNVDHIWTMDNGLAGHSSIITTKQEL